MTGRLLPPPARDLPSGHHQARRTHVLSEMTATPVHRRIARPRLVIGGVATLGLTAAAVTALVPSAPTARPVRLPQVLDAAQVLSLASKAAAGQPDLRPRSGQFLYFESKSAARAKGGSVNRKAWLSVDGRHAGLVISTGGPDKSFKAWLCDGNMPPMPDKYAMKGAERVDLKKPPRGCHDQPAYREGLPTDATAMRTWLYRNSQGGNPPDVQAFRTVGDTLRESYVPPRSLSAMFAAAAKMPGTTVTKNVRDLAGRDGIAVGQAWHGVRSELIFDPKTYGLLGEREVVDNDASFRPAGGKPSAPWKPDPQLKEGTVLSSTATVGTAITDQPGRPPTG